MSYGICRANLKCFVDRLFCQKEIFWLLASEEKLKSMFLEKNACFKYAMKAYFCYRHAWF